MPDPPRFEDPADPSRLDEPAPGTRPTGGAGDGPEPYRLDPDRAAASARPRPTRVEPVIDTRRYRWTIGIFALILVIAFSVYLFTTHGTQSPGVAAGKRLHPFVAPLASSPLNGDANTRPRCSPTRPNPEALNVCNRAPIVLTLFAAGSAPCVQQVDAVQKVSAQFRGRGIVFAAVAVQAGRAQARGLVRSHGWTIPVAYDRDGALAALYGVDICPMIELARRGGTVAALLIGEHWNDPTALAAQVRSSLG